VSPISTTSSSKGCGVAEGALCNGLLTVAGTGRPVSAATACAAHPAAPAPAERSPRERRASICLGEYDGSRCSGTPVRSRRGVLP
jgi:hypothetical protein